MKSLFPSSEKESSLDKREDILPLLYRFSPIVQRETLPEFTKSSAPEAQALRHLFWGVSLDISGCEKLFDGEVNLERELSRALKPLCPEHHIAIAPSFGAAWAFSRFGKSKLSIVSKRHLKTALASLPLAALRLNPKTLLSLEEVNLTHIEQLFSLPRKSLLSRFGFEVLQKLDQALGVMEEPLSAVSFLVEIRTEKVFTGPVLQLDGIQLTVAKLLSRLLRRLATNTQKPAHLILDIKKVQEPLYSKEIILSVPTDDETHLLALLQTQIERFDMGLGIESIAIRVSKTETIQAVSIRPIAPDPSPTEKNTKKQLGNLLDMVTAHLGPESIHRLNCHESYIPEKSFSFDPFFLAPQEQQQLQPNIVDVRPSLLFHHPSPVQVIAAIPDSPPSWIKWRGNRYRIRSAFGPERIAPEWWGRDPELMKTRDYFKIQLSSGAWLWVFRHVESQQWFLHGIWC